MLVQSTCQVAATSSDALFSYRGHVPEAFFSELLGAVTAKEEQELACDLADILDGVIGYLALCAKEPGRRLTASCLINDMIERLSVHGLYEELCMAIAGWNFSYRPHRLQDRESISGRVAATVTFMREKEIPFNPRIWDVADCDECTDCFV